MSTEATLEEQIQRQVSLAPIGQLAGIEEIATAAGWRNRRTQIMGGLGTFLVVALVLIGVGSALRDPEPSAVFAGEPTDLADPFQLVTVDGGYLGLSVVERASLDADRNGEFVLLASKDGAAWSKVSDAPVVTANTANVAVDNNGVVHIIALRSRSVPAGAKAEYAMHHAVSTDLVEWSSQEQRLPRDFFGVDRDVRLRSVVAAQPGVLVAVETVLASEVIETAMLEEFGDRDVCEREFSPMRYRARACGSSDVVVIPNDATDDDWRGYQLLFAPPDGDFVVTPMPEMDSPEIPFSPIPEIYATGDGFGLANWFVFESLDGLTWEEVALESRSLGNWSAAARGDERVYRSRLTFSGPDGPNGPPKHWGYSDDGGETFEWIRPETVFGDVAEPSFLSIDAGEAGWLATTVRRGGPAVDVDLGQSYDWSYRDFTMTNNGMTLRGAIGSGPATLTDDTGRVVRSWGVFEATHLGWAGFERTEAGVAISDEATGARLAEFTIEQWAALTAPGGQPQQYELLYSADGVRWTTVHRSSRFPFVQAIAGDEAVVTVIDSFQDQDPELVVLGLPVVSGS